jgi:hypothetical protein
MTSCKATLANPATVTLRECGPPAGMAGKHNRHVLLGCTVVVCLQCCDGSYGEIWQEKGHPRAMLWDGQACWLVNQRVPISVENRAPHVAPGVPAVVTTVTTAPVVLSPYPHTQGRSCCSTMLSEKVAESTFGSTFKCLRASSAKRRESPSTTTQVRSFGSTFKYLVVRDVMPWGEWKCQQPVKAGTHPRDLQAGAECTATAARVTPPLSPTSCLEPRVKTASKRVTPERRTLPTLPRIV